MCADLFLERPRFTSAFIIHTFSLPECSGISLLKGPDGDDQIVKFYTCDTKRGLLQPHTGGQLSGRSRIRRYLHCTLYTGIFFQHIVGNVSNAEGKGQYVLFDVEQRKEFVSLERVLCQRTGGIDSL